MNLISKEEAKRNPELVAEKTLARTIQRKIREEERQLVADEALARTARKETLKENRQRLRTEAANSTKAGDSPVIAALNPLSVRQLKAQEKISKDGKLRYLSKRELAIRLGL